MSTVLSARAAAARRGVSDRTIRRWIASGRLRADKVAGEFLIDLEELDILTGHAAAAAAAPRREPDSTAAPDTGGSRLGAASAAAPAIDLSGLLTLIERQQTQLLERTEAAAMWQERCRILTERLALAAPQQPQAGSGAPGSTEPPSKPAPAPEPFPWPLPPHPNVRAWWPWLLIVAILALAVVVGGPLVLPR